MFELARDRRAKSAARSSPSRRHHRRQLLRLPHRLRRQPQCSRCSSCRRSRGARIIILLALLLTSRPRETPFLARMLRRRPRRHGAHADDPGERAAAGRGVAVLRHRHGVGGRGAAQRDVARLHGAARRRRRRRSARRHRRRRARDGRRRGGVAARVLRRGAAAAREPRGAALRAGRRAVEPARLRLQLRAPLSSEMHCAFGASSLTDASFVSPTELACASPHAAGPSRSLPLMISLDGDAYSSEATPVLFTTTNPRRAPSVDEIAPDHAPLGGGVVVSLNGAGFSPAADYDGGLACFFGSLQPVDASFVSATAVRCTAPPASALTSAATTVPLSVGPRRGDAPPRSPAVPFTFYTPGGTLHVTSVVPAYGDVSSLAPLRVGGVGFAPLGAQLRRPREASKPQARPPPPPPPPLPPPPSTSPPPPPSRAQPSSRAPRPSCAPLRGASPSAPTPSKLRPTAVRPSRPAARRSSPTTRAPRRRRRR